MGTIRDGTFTVKLIVDKLCRAYLKAGKARLIAKFGLEFATAAEALVIACMALTSNDDYPFEVDRTPPIGPEDVT